MKPEKTKEELFEELPAKDKQAIIRAAQDEAEWYGNCIRCGGRVAGKLKDLRGKPCPHCGLEASNGR